MGLGASGRKRVGFEVIAFRDLSEAYCILDDVRALAKVYGKLVTNNGRDYMHIDDVKLNFVVQSASYEVEDDKSPLLSMTFLMQK
jgi:hypothetical protein